MMRLMEFKRLVVKLDEVAPFSTSRCYRLTYTSYLPEILSVRSSDVSGKYIFLLLMTNCFVESNCGEKKYIPETDDQSYVYHSRAFTKYSNTVCLC